jgi:hypothetical protein
MSLRRHASPERLAAGGLALALAMLSCGLWAAGAQAEPASTESRTEVTQAPSYSPSPNPAVRSQAAQVPQRSALDKAQPAPAAGPVVARAAAAGQGQVPTKGPSVSTGQDGQAVQRAEAARVLPQLAPATHTAEPPPALSSPVQGRNTAAPALAGRDRCDPATPAARTRQCARVIENRAAEYSAPDHSPLSPEQRLLAAQREAEAAPSDISAAARRLASGRTDSSDAAVALANITLSTPRDKDRDEEAASSEPSAVDALVAGILAQTGATGPPSN